MTGILASSAIRNNNTNNTYVNYDGKEVKVTADVFKNVEDSKNELEKKAADLKIKNKELSAEIEKLTSNIKNTTKIGYKDMGGVANGDEAQLNKSKPKAVIDNKNYYSENFVKAVAKNDSITYDEENYLTYIGKVTGKFVNLLDICPPYDIDKKIESIKPDFIDIQSKSYTNGFTLGSYSSEQGIKFNLDKKYKLLKIKAGHVDNTPTEYPLTLFVETDGNTIDPIILDADSVMQEYEISIENCAI